MDLLLLPGERSLGHKVKLYRIDRGLSQAELASLATERFRRYGFPYRKVTQADVGFLERDWRIFPPKQAAILAVLGLETDEDTKST